MEIILSKQCESLTGSLGRGFGYFIVSRWSRKDVKYRYYSQRSRWDVPPDGHLRFILTCADLAQSKLHIADISVTREELADALREARCTTPLYGLTKYPEDYPAVFNAQQVMKFKERYQLS